MGKLIIHDIKQGFVHNGPRLLLPVVIGIIAALIFKRTYDLNGFDCSQATLMEMIIFLYKGERYFPIEQLKEMYTLPALWLSVQIVISYLVGSYMRNDIYTYGQQVLMRCKNRWRWYMSKCVWNVMTVLYCYIVIDATIMIMTKIFGMKMSLSYDLVRMAQVSDLYIFEGTTKQMIRLAIIMPVIISIAVSLLQMCISLVFSDIIGFIVVQTKAIFATMVANGALIFNYGMVLRSKLSSPTDIKYSTGCVVCLIIAIISVAAGVIYFSRFDILSKDD